MDSYLQRQKYLARLQAVEVGKLLMGSGDGERTEPAPPARMMTADALLGYVGITL